VLHRLLSGDLAVEPPSVAAKPPLVVAMAANPIACRTLAEPGSQALGISSGVPGVWRARNCSSSVGIGRRI
jgi:hypothetical protein